MDSTRAPPTPKKRKHSMFSLGSEENVVQDWILEKSLTYESPTKWKRKISYSLDNVKGTQGKSKSDNQSCSHYLYDDGIIRAPFSEQNASRLSCLEEVIKDADDVTEQNSTSTSTNAKRSKFNPNVSFLAKRDDILNEFMRYHAPPGESEKCAKCGKGDGYIKCSDCFQVRVRCQVCILEDHMNLPTHRMKRFNGHFWERSSLRELGLIVQLGHGGAVCPSARVCKDAVTITVLDTTGIHDIVVMFCCCGHSAVNGSAEFNQVMQNGWYPATKTMPRTVASFTLLDQYEAIVCQGKLSAFHFYKSLVRLTDITQCLSIPRRYKEFVRMNREYQFIKMVQRAGKAFLNDSDIHDGELAVECPACPQPDRNLLVDWKERANAWIYTLYVMMDANFHLKQKSKNIKNDVALGDGQSYFVKDGPYKEHLKSTIEERDMKYCHTGLRAVDQAHKKGGQGYDVSGVFAVQCRHMLIAPNGIGDLQLGERQKNVDYVLLLALKDKKYKRLVVSYDIACQYCKKFPSRIAIYPKDMQLDLKNIDLEFVIPQFHIVGHEDKCRTRYSLRYREHMGRTDGENVERAWAIFNALSMATKEMGSGSRHDVLNYQFGDSNFQRILSFGRLFEKHLKEAAGEAVKHTEILVEFREVFPDGKVKEMDEEICKWDRDPTSGNSPYAEVNHGISMLQLRKLLAESERYESTQGTLPLDSISATHWLAIGMELEDLQYTVKRLFNGLKTGIDTVLNTNAVETNISALRRIHAWKSRQLIHMPAFIESASFEPAPDADEGDASESWEISLQFPSSLNTNFRNEVCSKSLIEKEMKLRSTAASDSLVEIRSLLQKQWWLFRKKKKDVLGTGQKRSTQSNLAIQSLLERRNKHVERYRRNRKALLVLSPKGEWRKTLKRLRDSDIRTLEDDEGKGEGRRAPSWIWIMKGASSDPEKDVYDGLRVEYAKSRVRALRWLEEVELVKEEMRRVVEFFNWKSKWWVDKAKKLSSRSDLIALGSIVYANQQANMFQSLGKRFRQQWAKECNMTDLPAVTDYPLVTLTEVIVPVPTLEFYK